MLMCAVKKKNGLFSRKPRAPTDSRQTFYYNADRRRPHTVYYYTLMAVYGNHRRRVENKYRGGKGEGGENRRSSVAQLFRFASARGSSLIKSTCTFFNLFFFFFTARARPPVNLQVINTTVENKTNA
jgi:hypothetical protein